MMRLISSELVAKNIARHRVYGLEYGSDETNERMAYYNPSHFLAGFNYGMELAQKLVNNQPTAYDIDKVVEELESLPLDMEAGQGYVCAGKSTPIWRAVAIVKRGGIDET